MKLECFSSAYIIACIIVIIIVLYCITIIVIIAYNNKLCVIAACFYNFKICIICNGVLFCFSERVQQIWFNSRRSAGIVP